MFKVGDIVKTKYEFYGSFRVVEVLNDTHMLIKSTDTSFDFNIAVKWVDWDIDPVQYRKTKVTKILGKLEKK